MRGQMHSRSSIVSLNIVPIASLFRYTVHETETEPDLRPMASYIQYQ